MWPVVLSAFCMSPFENGCKQRAVTSTKHDVQRWLRNSVVSRWPRIGSIVVSRFEGCVRYREKRCSF